MIRPRAGTSVSPMEQPPRYLLSTSIMEKCLVTFAITSDYLSKAQYISYISPSLPYVVVGSLVGKREIN